MGQGNSQMRKISSAAQWKGGEAPGQSVGYIGVGLNSYWAEGPEPPPLPSTFWTTGLAYLHFLPNCFRTVYYHLLPRRQEKKLSVHANL